MKQDLSNKIKSGIKMTKKEIKMIIGFANKESIKKEEIKERIDKFSNETLIDILENLYQYNDIAEIKDIINLVISTLNQRLNAGLLNHL